MATKRNVKGKVQSFRGGRELIAEISGLGDRLHALRKNSENGIDTISAARHAAGLSLDGRRSQGVVR